MSGSKEPPGDCAATPKYWSQRVGAGTLPKEMALGRARGTGERHRLVEWCHNVERFLLAGCCWRVGLASPDASVKSQVDAF